MYGLSTKWMLPDIDVFWNGRALRNGYFPKCIVDFFRIILVISLFVKFFFDRRIFFIAFFSFFLFIFPFFLPTSSSHFFFPLLLPIFSSYFPEFFRLLSRLFLVFFSSFSSSFYLNFPSISHFIEYVQDALFHSFFYSIRKSIDLCISDNVK